MTKVGETIGEAIGTVLGWVVDRIPYALMITAAVLAVWAIIESNLEETDTDTTLACIELGSCDPPEHEWQTP